MQARGLKCMNKVLVTERVQRVTYAIRDVVLAANEVEKTGKKIIKLNIGDPNVYDFDTPEYVRNALINAINSQKGFYSDSHGLPQLRKAVAEGNQRDGIDCVPEDVVITTGLSEATNMLLASLVSPGDNVVMPSPVYPQYDSLTQFYDGQVRLYDCIENEDWKPDIDDLRKQVDGRTRAIVLINPNNPTGALYDAATIKEIINVAGEFEVPIISDEIYNQITFDKIHTPTASLTKDVPVVTMNGLSKNYLSPGWRVGWIAFSNFPESGLRDAVLRLCRLRLCAPTPPQYASLEAITRENPEKNRELEKLRKRRDLTFKRLNEIPGISCTKVQGAFYAFPSVHSDKWKTDKEFVLQLLRETGVLTVYGSGFSEKPGTKHFRIVFLADEATLAEAFDKIEEFMKKNE